MAWSSSPVRNPVSVDASSNLVQAICPHCGDCIGPDDNIITTEELPVSSGDFTVCLSCREIIRFNDQLQLVQLEDQDWSDLFHQKRLLTAMLQLRMRLLVDQLREQRETQC